MMRTIRTIAAVCFLGLMLSSASGQGDRPYEPMPESVAYPAPGGRLPSAGDYPAAPPMSLDAARPLASPSPGAYPAGEPRFPEDERPSRPVSVPSPRNEADAVRGATPSLPAVVADVQIRGNRQVTTEEVLRHVRTSVGRPYDKDTIEADVRRLNETGLFVHIRPSTQDTPRGRVVIFDVLERRIAYYVLYVGNRHLSKKRLSDDAGIVPGDPLIPYAINEAKRKMLEAYHAKGFPQAHITVLEGFQSTDRGVIFLINEGPRQRVRRIEFVNNTVAMDERLKTQIETKEPLLTTLHRGIIPTFFGGELDLDKLERDVRRLEEYYRALGYFRCRVGHPLVEPYYDLWDSRDPDATAFDLEQWVTVKFVIDEGPRYKIRDLRIVGNEKFASEELMADLKLGKDDYYNQNALMLDRGTIVEKYGEVGHIFAEIDVEPRLSEEPGWLTLVYQVDEGRQCRVGKIYPDIQGDFPHTKWTTILNRMSIKPGDIVNLQELRESERRLRACGLFETNPTVGEPPQIAFSKPKELLEEEHEETSIAGRPERRPPGFRGQSPDASPRGPLLIDITVSGTLRHEEASSPARSDFAPGAGFEYQNTRAGQVPPPTIPYDAAKPDGGAWRRTPGATPVIRGQFAVPALPSQGVRPSAADYPTSDRSRQEYSPEAAAAMTLGPPPVGGSEATAIPPSGSSNGAVWSRGNDSAATYPGAGSGNTAGGASHGRDGASHGGGAIGSTRAQPYAAPSNAAPSNAAPAGAARQGAGAYAPPGGFTAAPVNPSYGGVASYGGLPSYTPPSSTSRTNTPGGSYSPSGAYAPPQAGGYTAGQAPVADPFASPYDAAPTSSVWDGVSTLNAPARPNVAGAVPATPLPPYGTGLETGPEPPYGTPPEYSGPTTLVPGNNAAHDPSLFFGRSPGQDPLLSVPLYPTVAETTTGQFMLSVGVNSDAGLMGNILLTERNFDIMNWPRSMSWYDLRNAFRGGGQTLRIEASPGTEVHRYTISFMEPYIAGTDIQFGVTGFYYTRFFPEWDEQRLGGRITLGYQWTKDFTTSFILRAEDVDIYNPVFPAPPTLADAVGRSTLLGLRLEATHDKRDHPFMPTEGYLMTAGVEQVLGTYDYPRADLDLRRYFTISRRLDYSGAHVLGVRGSLAVTGDETPIYEHFFAGGSQSIRGFDFREASPRENGVVVGGEFQLLSSVEYMFPLTQTDQLRGVVFCDAGTVEPDINNWDDRFRVAPGFGLRIAVPFMGQAPIALDFAFPVSLEPGDQVNNFSFFVGFLR